MCRQGRYAYRCQSDGRDARKHALDALLDVVRGFSYLQDGYVLS